MPPSPTKHIEIRRGENVRIGPISIITLIVAISLAVLAVLAVSTASATSAIAQRQADANERFYFTERVGQEFVAGIDDVLAEGGGVEAVEYALDRLCEQARATGLGRIGCTALVDGETMRATFICDGTHQLDVALTIRGNAYRIEEWKTSSAGQGGQSAGTLWTGTS